MSDLVGAKVTLQIILEWYNLLFQGPSAVRSRSVSSSDSSSDSDSDSDSESEEEIRRKSFTLKQLIRKLHIFEPVFPVMCLIGKKYELFHFFSLVSVEVKP